MPNTSIALPDEFIEDTILLIRGKRVILDQDLAMLYGVTRLCLGCRRCKSLHGTYLGSYWQKVKYHVVFLEIGTRFAY